VPNKLRKGGRVPARAFFLGRPDFCNCTIKAVKSDFILVRSPIDLACFMKFHKPSMRVRGDLGPVAANTLRTERTRVV